VDKTDPRGGTHRITDAAAVETSSTATDLRRGSSRAAATGAVLAIVAMVAGGWGLTALGRSVTRSDTASASAPGGPTPAAGAGSPTPAATAEPSAGAANPSRCDWVAAPTGNPQAKDVGTPPASGEPRTGTATMTLHTSLGNIVINIDLSRTPCTAASFAYLASKQFFNGSTCHRLVTQTFFVLQCGDPTGTGAGGPTYRFADENLPTAGPSGAAVYQRGVVALANTGQPVSNSSQFFITYQDCELSPAYTPFGTVTAGMSIVDKVAKAGTDNANAAGDGHPKLTLTIRSVTVVATG
jgi:peptidyl-prolyl cis-trans isomerase B (cyclophilin B)